ncbi:DUF2970 domain-containing protein [Parahaliea aestuarii]|uniref:DUF2970 domain-containing protein n=1 Tax=Parahaliea aestuarii TaxID=1852021 RepID=A0A5C8ZTM5_9GAMM|nr:DUF2970 domain-containing protein [Parahaliea aestuarii]TXS91144.1 DUF2970 domain-containing protein [Parahaliea aestuarii]
MSDREPPKDEKEKLSPWQVVASVFAAGFGVQSSRNRERDFKQGRFGVFIAAGIIFTLLFMGTVFAVVKLVLKSAGH